ncbi:Succinate dehydrogenase cytochrome b560 subunit, mitochondrial [Aphelenchoides bicaudatus]|nr:Succinate dehydrogenase cytochrome b560 subunit, mitochondrial [Aphelenchoides bicaudatus]
MMSQSLPGLRRTGIVVVRELRTSAIKRSEAQTPVQKFGFEYLKKQQSLHRPLSPHLSIYKPQLTWMLSGAHRFSGCLMGGTLLLGSFGFALLPFNYAQFIEYVRSWNIPCVVTGVFKFFIAYNIVFYALNGLRLLGFDLAKGTDLKSVYRSGWLVLGLSAFISFLVVLNSPPKKTR